MIHKHSKQRALVEAYMQSINAHVSAEQVFHDLNQNGKQISLATVYRSLDLLVQMHKIKRLAHPVNGYVYDKSCEAHYHLHCIKCQCLYDLPYSYQSALDEAARKESGARITSHSIIFEGICEACAKVHTS